MGSSELVFRECNESDLHTLTAVSRDTFSESFSKDNSQFNFEDYIQNAFSEDRIKQELENVNSEFYFSFWSDELIGYFKINAGSAQTDLVDQDGMELERIYVLYEYQNQGLGEKLLTKAIDIARKRSFPFLWLGVWEKNKRAVRFYERHGFVHSGYHPFKLGDEDQTDWIMKLEL